MRLLGQCRQNGDNSLPAQVRQVIAWDSANHDFWHGASPGYPHYAVLMKNALSVEEHLLNLSGLMAIGLVAWVNVFYQNFAVSTPLHLLFAVAFIVQSYWQSIGISKRMAQGCLLLMAAISVAVLAVNKDTVTLILSVVLAAGLPYHFTARQSWGVLLLVNVAYGLVFAFSGMEAGNYVYSWLTLLALQAFAITSSLAKQREVQAQETLARQNNELLAARAVMAQQNQTEERLRIAGDLHDTIGHRLTALQLQLEVLAHESGATHKSQVETCQQLAGDLLEDIRAIVRRMSEDQRNDLASAVQELEALTPDVSISLESSIPELNADVAQQLVFCFQEAISNAIRHGRASQIEIRFADSAFLVTDNGNGLSGNRVEPGFGLSNISARLAPFGGTASLENEDGHGCRLTLSLGEAAFA